MKIGRNRLRSTFTWESHGPSRPVKSVNFSIPLENSVIILEPVQNDFLDKYPQNKSNHCCDCNCCKLECFNCCKLLSVLFKITCDVFKIFKNVVNEKIQPLEIQNK